MSKPGSFHEAIDNDRNGEDTLLKSKGKQEQKDRSKRAKEIGGKSNNVCLEQNFGASTDLIRGPDSRGGEEVVETDHIMDHKFKGNGNTANDL